MFRKKYEKYTLFGPINQPFTDEYMNKIKKYKILTVSWFDEINVNCSMGSIHYFKQNPNKKLVIFDMINFILKDTNKKTYLYDTDYICNEKEQLCIYNDFKNTVKNYDSNKHKDIIKDPTITWITKIEN